ncbi:hypothetical protein Btru_067415 [Bulinus truncatus]|nr:hypothetical protein Btru_067415 [Bulinus truncatus]
MGCSQKQGAEASSERGLGCSQQGAEASSERGLGCSQKQNAEASSKEGWGVHRSRMLRPPVKEGWGVHRSRVLRPPVKEGWGVHRSRVLRPPLKEGWGVHRSRVLRPPVKEGCTDVRRLSLLTYIRVQPVVTSISHWNTFCVDFYNYSVEQDCLLCSESSSHYRGYTTGESMSFLALETPQPWQVGQSDASNCL